MNPAPISTAAVVAPDRRRYPGARSFEEPDSGRFFGRTHATDELLLRVLSVRLLLQFAPSGAGKTSLLNAGLYPKLRPHAYLPVNVRLNQPSESLIAAVTRSLKEAAYASELKDPKIPEGAESVWALLSEAQFWSSDLMLLTPVLVFDQFEEVFTLRDEKFREGFAREIGELTRGRHALTSPDQTEEDAPNVKVIISLREEYLGALEDMTVAIPDLFRERLRLVPLADAEAREAIVEPARLPGDWSSPPFEFTPKCLDGLVDFIDGVSPKIRVIETLTLQLVCERAEELATSLAPSRPKLELTLEDFGGMNGLQDLVRNYYNGVLDKLPNAATRKHAVELFERGLLDPSGKRLMLEQDAIARQFKLNEAALGVLVDRRLLRREPRNESIFYEISHDRLTDVINRHRSIPLPAWVRPTIAIGVALIIVMGVSLYAIVKAQQRAGKSEQATAQALNVLFGRELTLRLHDAGLSDASEQVLNKAPVDLASDPLSRARRLRLCGDLAWERATLAKSEECYLEGLQVIDAVIARGNAATTDLSAERAQILKSLGDVHMDRAEVSQAQARYEESVRAWDNIAPGEQNAMMRLNAIDTRRALASAWERLGDLKHAESAYVDAAQLSLDVLKAAYHQASDQRPDSSFALGRSIHMYADTLLPLALIWRFRNEMKFSRALASESLRLRPLSAEARRQMGAASAMYGGTLGRTREDEDKWSTLLEDSRKQFLELVQIDPRNLRLSRERAAVKLVFADGIIVCAERSDCASSLHPGELQSAEALVLDAMGVLQDLSARDPDSRSLRYDQAWGKSSQARVRSLSGGYDEALALIDEATEIMAKNTPDPKDNEYRRFAVDLMHTRASVLIASRRFEEALTLIDKSLVAADQLPSDVWRRSERVYQLEDKVHALKAQNEKADVSAIEDEIKRLSKPIDEQANERVDTALALNKEANALSSRARDMKGEEQRQGYDLAVDKYHEALAKRPGDPVIWTNLRAVCADAARTYVDDNGLPLSAEAPDLAKVESRLRCALESSWMASALSDEDTSQQDWAKRLSQLFHDRRTLALFLRNDDSRKTEALALAEQGVLDAEALAARDNSASSLFNIADAHQNLGVIREWSGREGWEPAIRAALVRFEHLRTTRPDDVGLLIWIGQVRGNLATTLEMHSLSGAETERSLARDACQRALGMSPTPRQLEYAQECIDDAQEPPMRDEEEVVPDAGIEPDSEAL